MQTPNIPSIRDYWSDKTFQSNQPDAYLNQQDCSDDGSSSSSGTVKMGALSSLEDFDSWMPPRESYHPDELCIPSLLHHIEEETAEVIQGDPSGTQNATSSSLKDAEFSPSYCTKGTPQPRVRIDSKPLLCNFGSTLRSETTQSLPNLRGAANVFESGLADQTCPEGTVCRIDAWDASVQLFVNAVLSPKGQIEIHHHAHLTVTISEQEINGAQICFGLVVMNGPRGNFTRHLEAGHSSLFFNEEPSSSAALQPARAEIEVIRNRHDLEKPLDLYFFSSYPTSDHDNDPQVLPSVRPSRGRVLSESIYLSEPVSPLIMETTARSLYSTWKASQHPLSHVTQFKRIDMPPLYPLGLRDDLRIKVMEIPPVEFAPLKGLAATEIVWDFETKVQQLPGIPLTCHMSLFVEVSTTSSRIVTFDSHGWIPQFFLVDGRLATEKAAEWRQLDGQLTLFRQVHMVPGPIKLELTWQEPPNAPSSNGNDPYELLLPRVLDREVAGGRLMCKDITVFLINTGTRDQETPLEVGAATGLPTMHKGYKVFLNRMRNPRRPSERTPLLSPIAEGVEANDDTNSVEACVFAPVSESPIAESDPDSTPDLEANNGDGPAGDHDPDQTGHKSRRSGEIGWPRIFVFIVMMFFLLISLGMWRPGWPSGGLRDGLKNGSLDDSRLSHDVVDLGRRIDPVEDLGLGTLTDSMIAGTESYGSEEEKEEGGNLWRDLFDYALGWPGPIYE